MNLMYYWMNLMYYWMNLMYYWMNLMCWRPAASNLDRNILYNPARLSNTAHHREDSLQRSSK
jgi:hypothetical protein